ncbi:MAG: type II secretion system F family protein [Micrococcales bacterium]|nr:type II secretion system F family protein [Micrococcales bacterium]
MSPRVDWSAAALSVQRLAVLLEAGLAPTAAFQALAAVRPDDPVVRRAAAAADSWTLADELVQAISRESGESRRAWSPVAATWLIATEAGAPIAPTLARLADVLRGLAQTARAVEVALAGPVASARILVLLPVIGVALGLLLGFDTGRVLFATPPGWVCLAIGLGLLVAGGLWSRGMLRRARRRHPAPGLGEELVAVALAGGLSPDRALASVRAALHDAGLPVELDGASATLQFARSAGAPAGALLRSEAEEARRSSGADAERAAEVLGVRLMLPLGLCILPAFLVLAVVPVVLSLVGSTLSGL